MARVFDGRMEREISMALVADWDLIQRAAPNAAWLPCDPMHHKELGCGCFGCVFPTNDDKIVFKATTDVSEVRFIQYGFQLNGIVEVYQHFPMTTFYAGEPLYGYWRQRATMAYHSLDEKTKQLIYKSASIASATYSYVKLSRMDGMEKLDEYYFDRYQTMCDALIKNDDTELLGQSLSILFERGIVMGDIKLGNLGFVEDRLVLIDPGISIAL